MAQPPKFAGTGMEITNSTSLVPVRRRHNRVQPPTHSGPPSQSLVITTNIPPITVNYGGTVRQYSRHKIARDLRMHPATISMYFSGKRNLTLNMALRFRSYFKVSLDYLVDELMPNSRYLVAEATNEQRAKFLHDRQVAEVADQSDE